MENIKVGQIWQDKNNESIRFAILEVGIYNYQVKLSVDGCVKRGYYYIDKIDSCNLPKELIKEYPTWRKAIQSKEFKGE